MDEGIKGTEKQVLKMAWSFVCADRIAADHH